MVGAVLLAGLAGALFSPIAGRLRGIYLGLASLGLVFIGQHILFNATGHHRRLQRPRRRAVQPVRLQLLRHRPRHFVVARRALRRSSSGSGTSAWCSSRVSLVVRAQPRPQPPRPRAGRRCATARSPPRSWASTSPATRRPRSRVSSMYAGLAGVLPRARLRAHRARVVRLPALDRLPGDDRASAGSGSIGGAVAGRGVRQRAAAGPQPLQRTRCRWSPSRAAAGCRPREAARFLYGAAVVAVLLFAPHGWRASRAASGAGARTGPRPPSSPRRAPHESLKPRSLASWLAAVAAAGRRRRRLRQQGPRTTADRRAAASRRRSRPAPA